MSKNLIKILSIFISFCLILEQSVFAQTIDLSHYFVHGDSQNIPQTDKFRPLHLRYISYDSKSNDFKLLLDKGDFFNQQTPKLSNSPNSLNSPNSPTPKLEEATQELMKYFFIGLSLPNEKFWVNLRPDSPDNILDPELEKTDIGRIFLEADLQLKKDTSGMTSPQNPEGKAYWDKLYKKAGELFGSENITIPTITRPWIVPSEIIIREAPDNAYIYKATLKVMLEEDYLSSRQSPVSGPGSWFLSSDSYLTADRRPQTGDHINDPRLKELNEYSTQLIKETIIPKLTYAVNTAKRYAPLRQVYYSLILAQWFKQKYGPGSAVSGLRSEGNSYIKLIDSGNLANLTSNQPYDKQDYFQQYQKSFKDGEYNLQEPVYTPMGQNIRRYTSGGIVINKARPIIITAGEEKYILERNYLISSDMSVVSSSISIAEKLVKGIVNKYRQSLGSYPIKVHCLNVKDELILALILALNNPELKSFSNQENFFIMMFELIENAIKHGEGYPVEIYFRAKENNLIIEVKDYGKGIDFEKLAELLRGAAMNGFIQEHGYMKGVPVVMPQGRNGFIMTKIMLPEEVEAFIRNSKSEIPFVSGLSTDEGRMIIGGAGLYAARRYAKDSGGDLTYETGQGGTTFTIRLPIALLSSASSAVGGDYVDPLDIIRKGNEIIFQGKKYKIAENKPMSDETGRRGVNRIYEILLRAEDGGEKQILAKWVEKQRALNDIIATRVYKILGLPSYQVEIFDLALNENNLVWEFIESIPSRLLAYAFSYPDDNIYDFHQDVKGIEEILANNEEAEKRMRGLGGIFAVELLLGTLDCKMEHILWRKLDGMPFRIDSEFSLLSNSENKNQLSSVMRGDEKTFLRELKRGGRAGGKQFVEWVIIGFNDIWRRLDSNDNLRGEILNVIRENMASEQYGTAAAAIFNYSAGAYKINETMVGIKNGEALTLEEQLTEPRVIANSPVISINDDKGGIAFNALPIQTESVASSALGALSGGRAFKGDLDAEWTKIQSVFNAGVRPSIQRLSEYTAAASASPLAQDRIDQVRVMLADILRRDEESERLAPAEESCKQLLRALEAG